MSSFKIGQRLLCVEPSSGLTKDRVYLCRDVSAASATREGMVTVINDHDRHVEYFAYRFVAALPKVTRKNLDVDI